DPVALATVRKPWLVSRCRNRSKSAPSGASRQAVCRPAEARNAPLPGVAWAVPERRSPCRCTVSAAQPFASAGGALVGASVGAAAAGGAAASPAPSSPPVVSRVRLLAARISLTGWKKVSPPTVQSPEPPEVTPCAWSPESHGPPESPPSAQTLVRVRPVTAPSGYTTVWFLARIVPQNVPVVEPERQIAAPTGASVLPATGSRLPLKSLTNGCSVSPLVTCTKPSSLSPGKIDAL